MNWYQSLPPAEAQVPCGAGTHAVRWEAGQLALAAHPDLEAELVLTALGGDKPLCLTVAEAWDRHADDLDVLIAGPRSRADMITSGWDDAREHWRTLLGLPPGSLLGPGPGIGPGGGSAAGGASARAAGPGPLRGPRILERGLVRLLQSRTEMLRLLALGPAFQFRLAGTVAAAWSAGREHHAGRRPELVAALTGRLAPAVAEWLGIDPDSVSAAPLDGAAPTAWGTLETFGSGADRRVRASLPFGWLASVWACGLAVVDGHLVVAVEQPGWPHARVLALREPGTAPVQFAVVATDDAPLPHWAISA
jgi:hypothetical protein